MNRGPPMTKSKQFVYAAVLLLSGGGTLFAQMPRRPDGPPEEKAEQNTSEKTAEKTKEERAKDEKSKEEKGKDEKKPEEKIVQTKHTIRIGGQEIKYTATAGTILLKLEDGTPKASVFYIAYTS